MSIHRKNPRRDANEAAIVQALEAVGASVLPLSVVGGGDLLVGFQGRNYLLEIKTSTGELTIAQTAFKASWRGDYAIVRTPDEALQALGIGRRTFKPGDWPWLRP